MRRLGARSLALAAVLAIGAPAAAQSPSSAVVPTLVDPAALEALCAANTPDAASLATCLDVVHRYLVPGSGTPSTPPSASASPETAAPSSLPSLGFTYADPNLAVSLLRVE